MIGISREELKPFELHGTTDITAAIRCGRCNLYSPVISDMEEGMKWCFEHLRECGNPKADIKEETANPETVVIPGWAIRLNGQLVNLQIQFTLLRAMIDSLNLNGVVDAEGIHRALAEWSNLSALSDRP